MSLHPHFTRYFNLPGLSKYENWKLCGMIASTMTAVCNHFCREAGLTSRTTRRRRPDLGVRIIHDAEARVATGKSERRKRAIRIGSQASKRSKDSSYGGQQGWSQEWSEDEEEDETWGSWQQSSSWDTWQRQDQEWEYRDEDDSQNKSSSSWSRPSSWTRRY